MRLGVVILPEQGTEPHLTIWLTGGDQSRVPHRHAGHPVDGQRPLVVGVLCPPPLCGRAAPGLLCRS